MGLTISKTGGKGKKYPALKAGTYPARVVRIVDLGMQYKTTFGTKDIEVWADSGSPKMQLQVWIDFEMPTQMVPLEGDGEPKPYVIGKQYTVSMHEMAALPPLMEAAGATDDMSQLLGKGIIVKTASPAGATLRLPA